MNKFLLIFIIILASTIQLSVNAFDFGSFFKNAVSQTDIKTESKSASNSTSSITNTLASLDSQLAAANTQTQSTFLNIVSMLSSKNDFDMMQYKINTIMNNKSKTETEKSSLITQLITNYKNDITGSKSNEIISAIRNMQTSERQALVNKVAELAQNGSSYFALAKNYTTAVSAMAKTSSSIAETANALSNAKQAAVSLKENATAVTMLTSSISTLLQQAE